MKRHRSGLIGEASRYAVVGVTNVAIDVFILSALVRLTGITSGLEFVLFATVGFICAVTNGYYWNCRWTFGAAIDPKRQFLPFAAIQLVGVVINDVIMVWGTYLLSFQSVPPLTRVYEAKAAAIIIVAVWNFAISRSLVFRMARVDPTEVRGTP